MTNTRYDGKLSKAYLRFEDFDITADDTTILADAGWSNMCVIECEDDLTKSVHTIEDTCTGDEEVSIPKSRKRSIKGELYMFRVTDGTDTELLRELEDAVDSMDQIVSAMILNDARDSALANGSIGNYILTKLTKKNSAADLIKCSIEFEPAALSAFVPITRHIRAY